MSLQTTLLETEFNTLNQRVERLLQHQEQLANENDFLQTKVQQLNAERLRLRGKLKLATHRVKQIIQQLKEQLA